MALIYQSPALANVVFEALAGSVNPETTSYRAAVAYATREGAKTLVTELASRVGATWEVLPKTLITCFDFGTTEPGALEYLRDAGFDVRIANVGPDGAIRLMSNPSSYHPKVYLAPDATIVRAVVGSANLSRRALTVNTEAVATVELGLAEAETLWAEIEAASVELTPELLLAYKAIRPKQQVAPPPDEPPIPPPVPSVKLRVFRLAVEGGYVEPAEYEAFWVEVGSPSGGSGNQLELPRRAQRFFGYDFDDYDDEHHTIGYPVLTTPTARWVDRRLTWHGNNGMERINLPTTAQSGLTYGHKVILFERSGNAFKITVAEPDSARAQRWRDESAAAGTLFRFSAGSNRRCGLI